MFAAIACSSSPDETPATSPPVTFPSDSHPAIAAITPNEAFLGRTIHAVISGSETAWADGATVDFGDGVQVDKVIVASPASLVVTASVSESAALGPRDVHVAFGGGKLDYTGGFTVVSPLSIDVKGTQAQGSALLAKLRNLDTASPFDTTEFGDGVVEPVTFPNLKFAAAGGVTVHVTHADAFALDLVIEVDVMAKAGASSFDLASGPSGSETHFALPDAMTIATRTAQSLPMTGTTQGNLAEAYASSLYQLEGSSGLSLVEIQAASMDAKAVPAFAVLPASGLFADASAFSVESSWILESSQSSYLVYWDASGAAGYDFHIDTVATSLTAVAEAEPNDDAMTAQTAQLPFYAQATLSSAMDQDWFTVGIAASDVGKRVRIWTDGDPRTDTWVDVLGSDGVTSLGGPSADSSVQEDFLSDPVTAEGTYYVKVVASPYFDPAHGAYGLLARLE